MPPPGPAAVRAAHPEDEWIADSSCCEFRTLASDPLAGSGAVPRAVPARGADRRA